MNGHKVHALLSMSAYNAEKVLSGYLKEVLFKVSDSVVHRNCAYHGRGLFNESLAEGVGLAIVG